MSAGKPAASVGEEALASAPSTSQSLLSVSASSSSNVISAIGKSPLAVGAAVIGVSASVALSYWMFSKKSKKDSKTDSEVKDSALTTAEMKSSSTSDNVDRLLAKVRNS
jgi:hypothetical protein